MALRKCPGCKNLVAAESESCPICGCDPRTRQVMRVMFWGAAAAVVAVAVQGPIRQHLHGVHAAPTARAATAVSPH